MSHAGASDMLPGTSLASVDLSAFFFGNAVVRNVSLDFPTKTVTSIIGPSGCGKSTFLRCLNRMHEMSDGGTVTGTVLLNGENVYSARTDPIRLRKQVGMVFQKPTPFPTMTIAQNVVAGLRTNGTFKLADVHERVEPALRSAGLWDEVVDRLDRSAM